MKTPEEIKKALEICRGKCTGNKPHCPYAKYVNGCEDTLNRDALAYIQQLEAQQPRWISVKERLPENGQKVIATFKNEGGVIVDQARYSNGEFDFASWAYVWHENITHWIPMPEPPEGENAND